jgi:hypothetical protein
LIKREKRRIFLFGGLLTAELLRSSANDEEPEFGLEADSALGEFETRRRGEETRRRKLPTGELLGPSANDEEPEFGLEADSALGEFETRREEVKGEAGRRKIVRRETLPRAARALSFALRVLAALSPAWTFAGFFPP